MIDALVTVWVKGEYQWRLSCVGIRGRYGPKGVFPFNIYIDMFHAMMIFWVKDKDQQYSLFNEN